MATVDYGLRNDTTGIVKAGIPAEVRAFSCGYWGRHAPPRIEDDHIVLFAGEGYRSNKHLHYQNFYLLEADAGIALVECRKGGDLYGSGMWHYLVGVDDVPFVTQIPSTIDTLAGALASLEPVAVQESRAAGLDIKRQGDWFFIPREPRRKQIVTDYALGGTGHVASEAVPYKTKAYVRGTVAHSEHGTLELDRWHLAVRNNAIRTGRLARGGGVD